MCTRKLSASLTAALDLYDPATNTWSPATEVLIPRAGHAATFLHSDQVLVTGGRSSGGIVTTTQRHTR